MCTERCKHGSNGEWLNHHALKESFRQWFGCLSNFVLAGILALFGIFKVYTKFQMGDPGVMTAAISWFGSAIFLVVAITVIKSFFDIG